MVETSSPVTQPHSTLDEFLIAERDRFRELPGLDDVLRAVAGAAERINQLVRRASLAGVLGATGEINVQGEVVQQLDNLGTELFVEALRRSGRIAALACEELGDVLLIEGAEDAPFFAVFDPIDGSSNIDVAVPIGSIFGFYARSGEVSPESLLRPGSEQVAAAYIVYGSCTMLVLATKESVDGFTLDETIGEFVLSHPGITLPAGCPYYSVNEAYQDRWDAGMQRAIAELRSRCSLRYVGSLVSDFHRTLLKGGIFAYPADKKQPQGKLRLLYEASPLAFIIEQAGGAASSGRERILTMTPDAIHQRTPLIIGDSEAVAMVEQCVAQD